MRLHEVLPEDADWADHHGAAMAWLHIGPDDVDQWDEALRPILDAA